MRDCEVLIVGGGPAGATCARRLRAAGLDTVVLDKAEFPRDKTCAGWITPAVAETVALDLEAYARGNVLQPITGFRTRMMGRPQVETRYDEPVSYGIRRCEFDTYLLERSGAELALGRPLKSLERDGQAWVANGEIRARLVVGAGGHFCPVARLTGLKADDETIVAAKEIEFEMSQAQAAACSVRENTPELDFCEDLKGYGWVFRKDGYLNVGLGREDKAGLGEHLERFVEQLKAEGRIPADLPAKFKGHAYLLYGHAPRRLVDDGLMLIGDAAGLAYPQSGEGIRPAVESAVMAAQVIEAARGDYSASRLAPYARAIVERFGERPATTQPPAPGPVKAALQRAAAAWLMRSRWFARHFVIDRWFLHRQQPVLSG